MARVIILGSNGFVGRHLAAAFPDATCYGGRKDLDVRSAAAVDAVDFTDAVVFVCCSRGGRRGVPDGDDVYSDNMVMLINLMNQPLRQCRRMVFFSSGAAFGRMVRAAGAEPPTTPPVDPYGASKAELEQAVHMVPKVTVLRIFGCFGNDEEPQRLRATCLREGRVAIDCDRPFDYVDVEDVARFAQWLVAHPEWTHRGAFNLVYQHKKKLSEWALGWDVAPSAITIGDASDLGYIGEYHGLSEMLA